MAQSLGRSNPMQTADDPQDFRFGAAGGRMRLVSATRIEYAIFNGNVLEVNGVNVTIGPVGASTIQCNSTDNLIDADGNDAGTPPSEKVRYYAYVSNGADGLGVRMRLSLEPPDYVKGILYLGTTGGAVNWRFVGYVALLGGTPNFRDDITARLVCNYYNRQREALYVCPGYNDNNAETTLTLASGTVWAGLNAGTNDNVAFLSNGEDAIEFEANVHVNSSGASNWNVGIGVAFTDTSARTQADIAACVQASAARRGASCALRQVKVEALYWASLNVFTNSTTPSVICDFARTGNVVDPPATCLTGTVWA